MDPIVQVEHVCKKYSRNANAHLSYGLGDLFRHLLGRKPSLELRKDEFFAVKDVSLELEPGETLALIGRNGSGKSTLLKMMNGLVKPDAGRIVMNGRVQALINLGAGFNGALSGTDNIYNSAALYGFNRRQTRAIADEIVAFAELEEFINSPVETYSSGMKARLGFAVSVHLQPDILLIDEILSVGDHAFQNKCHRRMQDLKKRGVTIVLVSHAHTRVMQLCQRALWLHKGVCMQLGESKEVVSAYLNFLEGSDAAPDTAKPPVKTAADNPGAPAPHVSPAPKKKAELFSPIHTPAEGVCGLQVRMTVNGKEADRIPIHSTVAIEYEFLLTRPVADMNVTLGFFREDGERISGISTLNGDLLKNMHEGRIRCKVVIPDFNLAPGNYVLILPIHEGHSYLYRDVVRTFSVTSNEKLVWGVLDLNHTYSVEQEIS